jgi:hypothetical protein
LDLGLINMLANACFPIGNDDHDLIWHYSGSLDSIVRSDSRF